MTLNTFIERGKWYTLRTPKKCNIVWYTLTHTETDWSGHIENAIFNQYKQSCLLIYFKHSLCFCFLLRFQFNFIREKRSQNKLIARHHRHRTQSSSACQAVIILNYDECKYCLFDWNIYLYRFYFGTLYYLIICLYFLHWKRKKTWTFNDFLNWF